MDVENIRSRTQLLTQLGAVFAVVLYAVGFLIVSLHHGFFGISQFSLLRPKILSAGILFLVFLGLPVLETARVYGFWGLGYIPTELQVGVQTPFYVRLMRAFSFLVAAVAISFILRPFLADYRVNVSLLYWGLVGIAPGTAAIMFIHRRGKQHPTISSVMMVLAILLVMFCIWRMNDATLAILVAWFCLSGLAAHYLNDIVTAPEKLRHLNWHIWLTNAVAIVGAFAIFVYPRIPTAYGGGEPVPATIRLVENGLWGDKQERMVWLIDETDLGFYILKSKDAKQAIFIPRSSVGMIYFGDQIPDEPNGQGEKVK